MADLPYRPFNAETPSSGAMPYQRSPVDADTFGASTGRALQGLGQSISRDSSIVTQALMRRRDEQDANLATDANTAFMEKATELQDGYQQKTGRDAYQALPEFKKSLDDLWKETEGTLQSDGAKRLFTDHTRRFYVASLSDGSGYANKQFKAWSVDSAQGRADALANQASLNIANPAQMQQFLVQGGAEVRKAQELAGAPPEMAEAEVQKYWGKSIKGIVTLQAKDDPQVAMATLQKFGPIMDPQSRAETAAALRPLAREQEAKSIVNTAMGVPNATGARGSQAGGTSGYANNVGNLRVSGADWIGKGSPFNGFETFRTPEQGVAATVKNIQHIADTHGGDLSIEDLITTWAPASDGNSPAEYAATVATAMGMDVDDDVPLDDPKQMTQFVKAMARVEKGKDFDRIPDDAFAAGVNAVYEGAPLANPPMPSAAGLGDAGGMPDKSLVYQHILEQTGGDPDLTAAAFSEYNQRLMIHNALTETSRGKLQEQLPSVMTAAMQGAQTVTLPLDLMRQSGMSEQEFSDTVTQFDTSKRVGVMTQGLAFAPESDLQAAKADIDHLSGPIGAAINEAAGGPEGTGNQAMRLALQEGAQRQIKQMQSDRQNYLFGDNADPATYVATAPGVVAARQELQQANMMASRTNDPGVAVAATQNYAAAVLGQQAALGVPVDKRRVLSRDQAARLGQALSPQDGQSGEQAVKTIREGADTWGPAWSQILTEMGPTLNDIGRTIAVMPTSMNFAAAQLAEAGSAKKELEEATKSKNSDIKEAIGTAFDGFLSTFAGSGVGGMKEGARFMASGELLTRRYVQAGATPDAAAQKAYHEIIGSQYDVTAGARIPKPYDGDLVVRGAETVAQQLFASGADLDPVMDDLGAGDAAHEQYMASLRVNHSWTNAPDGKGLVMLDGLGKPVLSGGKPVYRTFDQLAATEPAPVPTGLPQQAPLGGAYALPADPRRPSVFDGPH